MKKTSFLLLLIIALQTGLAQQLQVTTYTEREGVPAYGANSIFQDRNGWMWFTSGYEVMRYDGHRFRTFHPAANTPMEYCFQVFEVDGEIWVNAAPQLLKLTEDSLRSLNIENNTGGIVDYLEHKGQSFFLGRRGISRLLNGKLAPYIIDQALSINRTESIEVYNDSLLVSHQFGRSLLVFDLERQTYQSFPLQVTDTRQDENGNILLLVKGKGILRLKKITRALSRMEISTEPVYLFDDTKFEQFAMDGQGNCWVFKQFEALVKLSPGNPNREFNESHGLPSLWFNQLFIDREKNLWIGFNSGLSKIRNTNWERYTIDESLYSNHILFFAKGSHPGQVYITTRNGLNVFDKGQIRQVQSGNQAFRCDHLLATDAKLYYIRDSALFSAIIDQSTFKVRSAVKLAHLGGPARQLVKDRVGNIYITTTKALYIYSGKQLTRLLADSIYFREILIDRQDRLWAGDFVGKMICYRIRYDGSKPWISELFRAGLVSPAIPEVKQIRAIAEDPEGNIFAGTRYNGLFIFNVQNDKLVSTEHFGEKNGLPSNSIWSLTIDATGACWIASAKGLNRMQKLNDRWVLSDEGTKRQLYQSVFVFATPDNHIWVANHPGAVVIRNNDSVHAKPFSVFITGIAVNGRSFTGTREGNLRLRHNKNDVGIQFSANTYRDEGTVLYSWRLDENEKWSLPVATNAVNYSALGPGKYLFMVKAVNADGHWSSNETGFEFRVLPPFWQQAWFIALLVAIFGMGLYLLYRYRVKRIKELYEMRNIIARDLHDEIGSTLTSINILSKVSHRNLQKDDHKAAELLEKVIDQSQQIQQNMSDIVWAIRPDNDRIENMTVRMREYLSHTLEPGDIKIDFSVDETVMRESLTMQQRRDFFLIFKEAVNNIAKYSKCKTAEIYLIRQNGDISLTIKDDGIGFDTSRFNSSGGLQNMQRRAELLKGSLQIWSSAGEGTRIELRVPATS